MENMLCLCPNHHVLFDNGAFTIDDQLCVKGSGATLRTANSHSIGTTFLTYHRQFWGG
jgi:putative restriction endonuclease